jgi:UDP-N-acetylmuramate dehydrogenase
LLAKRSASQPTQQANAGSVFRNPPNDYAARLIETAGLKGECIGGACVSTLHANFIVNTGEATARDIETLIHRVQERVVALHGVRLVTEVHIVGDVA